MPDHAADPQAEVFREADPATLTTDDDIAAMIASGELAVTTDHPITSPADYERSGWDAGRETPKTVEEAREALAARVDDPNAPDRDATAYDNLAEG